MVLALAGIPESVLDDALSQLERPWQRPTPRQWLRYAVLATAPAGCRSWVLHDITCRTWVLRNAARVLVLIVPLAVAVMAIYPLSLTMRLLIVLNAGLPAFFGGMLMTLSATERRAARAGYPAEIGQAIRQRRSVDRQITANRARRERIAARQARRAG
jgi:hypothetical protein